MSTTDLSKYDNSWYRPGANFFVRGLWYLFNIVYFKSGFPFSGPRRFLLRLFGAKVGKGVVIRHGTNIKYPWNLEIGDHCWIGERVWIDNLGKVTLGSHVCLSQGAFLLTGNHNYKKVTFDLLVGSITIGNGAWIGARAVVCPGVICGEHSVLSVGSVAVTDLDAYGIYQGNPAVKVRDRVIQ
jgi:putative colanic acid biosynthesis acetyltransferase WcaF